MADLTPTPSWDQVPAWNTNTLANGETMNAPAQALLNRSEYLKVEAAKKVLGVNSINDMLAIQNPNDGMVVYAKSYHAGLNRGGGYFVYDASLSDTNNGGSIIQGWKRQTDKIDFAEFGGFFNDSSKVTANNAVLASMYTAVATTGVKLITFGKGEIHYSVSPNWGVYQNLILSGAGDFNTILKYSGTETALSYEPTKADQQFRYGNQVKGILIDLGANGKAGTKFENQAHFKVFDVWAYNGAASAIHHSFLTCVLGNVENVGTPINRVPETSYAVESVRIAASTKLLPSTANVFTNIVAEGATSHGLRLIAADNNVFVGGTVETNTGYGATIATEARNNTFIGTDLENNTLADITDSGQGTKLEGVLATSPAGSSLNGTNAVISGGYYDKLVVNAASKGASVTNIQINVKGVGTGGFTDNGFATHKRNIYDKTNSAFVYNKKLRISVTPTGSPFTWKNTTGERVNVLIRSGTVSQVQMKRGADTVILGDAVESTPRNGLFELLQDDEIVITYSAAPTINIIHLGV